MSVQEVSALAELLCVERATEFHVEIGFPLLLLKLRDPLRLMTMDGYVQIL